MFRARLQGLNFLQVSLALTLVWTTAAYQVVALSSNLGYQTYYVKPTAEGGSHGMQCPGVCHNLSYYLKNVSHYFTHNTKFYFMSGVHEVNSTGLVCIRDISNLVLEGSNKSDVRVVDVHLKTINVTQPTSILHCSLPSGFVFLNVTN